MRNGCHYLILVIMSVSEQSRLFEWENNEVCLNYDVCAGLHRFLVQRFHCRQVFCLSGDYIYSWTRAERFALASGDTFIKNLSTRVFFGSFRP